MREERRPSDPSSVSVKRGNIFDLVAPVSLSISIGGSTRVFVRSWYLIASYFILKTAEKFLTMIACREVKSLFVALF